MIGYIASSAISLLNFFATAEGVQSYIIWGMGNFGGVSLQQMPAFASVTLLGLVGALMLIKPLNALLLGERYAENLGVNIRRVRNWLLVVTGLLTAITTAFCGPVAFIGPGRPPCGPHAAGHVQPPLAAARHHSERWSRSPSLQPDLHLARRCRHYPTECSHSHHRRAGHHLRHCKST